ncbi:acid beta-fructofuranosidase [Ricinus communis]|uniref:beta-fructofuranosidase n=1 Tax=Ricinus communis TaxID=3988 RepID=B9T2V7_RICCO|nr:acid beta-fructofuranosidase [Ricinus communis]EEF29810.1 Acid beta-fructofuranosidase precursor, putative [Ricinus communis]|eukprot:XP_002532576.1 acid beta-fructofuranosidase [Ricinus communis]
MADPNPFLPISQPLDPLPDGGSPPTAHRRQSKKMLFVVFSGLFLVFLFAAIIDNNKGFKNNIHDDNVIPLTMSQETVKPEILRPVSRGVSAGISEKVNLISSSPQTPEYPWNNSMLSWQRSAFHFQPEKNWMNDPNGPLFYNGWYHFFYQYNPNAAVWGDIVWGHAVSKDLIHWLHLPLAMVADEWYDQNGVWTGSATILPDGKIVMLYTGSTNESVQVQNLAYPEDHDDPLLLKWVKYSGNPVLVPPPGIKSLDFRDPTTAWFTSEGKWRITIGSKVGRTGIALIYDTEDFINYELQQHELHGVSGTGMWECVDFYPVSKSSANGLDTSANGPQVKHVLKTSLDDDRHDYYALGNYNEKNGTWYPDNPEIDTGIGIRYDYGIFYASKTFYDQNKGRRLLWGWIGESDSEAADVKKGWASLQSIPRTVLLDTKTGSNLLQWPVEEVESLRLRSNEFEKLEVKPGSVVPLHIDAATQLDIVAEFELDKKVLANAAESNEEFSCKTSRGAAHRNALGPFGLLVLADESLAEQTPVYFYVAKGKNGTLKTFFCTDQKRSSAANDVNKQIYGNFVPVLEGEKFSVRILVDHSIIESFAQGGRTCITSRVYPTRAIYGAAKLFLFNNALEANVTASLKIWQMNSAFIRPYPNIR